MQPIFTIGHSTRPIDELIELLRANNISQLIDIRTIPKSRHNPQYQQSALEESLKKAKINYLYLPELGGLRPSTKSTTNDAWRNKSFQNYADYMQTNEFSEAIEKLLELSRSKTSALMCAEAVPWRCHRSLVGDALVVRQVPVLDIISATNISEHTLTSFAVVDGTTITYPQNSALK